MDARPHHPSHALNTNATDPVLALHSNEPIAGSWDHGFTPRPLTVIYNALQIRPPGIVAGDLVALLEHLIQLGGVS
jgi:hypothetical protein